MIEHRILTMMIADVVHEARHTRLGALNEARLKRDVVEVVTRLWHDAPRMTTFVPQLALNEVLARAARCA